MLWLSAATRSHLTTNSFKGTGVLKPFGGDTEEFLCPADVLLSFTFLCLHNVDIRGDCTGLHGARRMAPSNKLVLDIVEHNVGLCV